MLRTFSTGKYLAFARSISIVDGRVISGRVLNGGFETFDAAVTALQEKSRNAFPKQQANSRRERSSADRSRTRKSAHAQARD